MIYVVIYALLVLRFQQTVVRVYYILNYKVFKSKVTKVKRKSSVKIKINK